MSWVAAPTRRLLPSRAEPSRAGRAAARRRTAVSAEAYGVVIGRLIRPFDGVTVGSGEQTDHDARQWTTIRPGTGVTTARSVSARDMADLVGVANQPDRGD